MQVPQQVVREVASPQQLAKLQNFALRSFVEDNRTFTWCPAPGAHLQQSPELLHSGAWASVLPMV